MPALSWTSVWGVLRYAAEYKPAGEPLDLFVQRKGWHQRVCGAIYPMSAEVRRIAGQAWMTSTSLENGRADLDREEQLLTHA